MGRGWYMLIYMGSVKIWTDEAKLLNMTHLKKYIYLRTTAHIWKSDMFWGMEGLCFKTWSIIFLALCFLLYFCYSILVWYFCILILKSTLSLLPLAKHEVFVTYLKVSTKLNINWVHYF